ncbi:MAG: cob(I)yrinic acid a,c-diamide adenosyltransferase [Candidatus Cloacimonetes bacterium]|nr:cob(I)yrinic acid a,c-diamide adenosyltransferase [Candidatus Cloacimonadota bacterium]
MSIIATKTGDKGETSLYSGERVRKDDIRVESYGTIDELDAHLGEAKHHIKQPEIFEIIENIQKELKRVMGELASVRKRFPNPISEHDVELLNSIIEKYEKSLEINGFVISGKTMSSAKLDICRTVCRRAERHIMSLSSESSVSEHILAFVNRLSDVLYIFARLEER